MSSKSGYCATWTESELSDYCTHALDRDCNGQCMITGFQTEGNAGIGTVHIFPQEWEEEWIRRGYPSKIIDTAGEEIMGGPTKIDSIQNILTLQLDLCCAWDNYEFGVDPNNNYHITDFIWGNCGISGLHLWLDHIQDSTLRPLDELFTEHFIQCIYRHMKGIGEAGWTDEDITALINGSFNTSGFRAWDTMQGKQLFELVLANRLFYPSISQHGEYSQDSKPTLTEDESK
ncbi:hypothetical protein Clacol_010422 [Clathrus columnatus]|uniref:HNH nuclease domain-containing protein n=1 Tax=Clathrus columnatus TaxID=1419009 RepID=A0AAV5AN89_9AGAM|nr:hypothetical protein Clacol_010422 [Clathrus columnatus]